MINDLDEPFNTLRNHDSINSLNSNTINTKSMNVDAGIIPNMARELQQLRRMISIVSGVVQPIPEASSTSYRISRFSPAIADTKVPKHF